MSEGPARRNADPEQTSARQEYRRHAVPDGGEAPAAAEEPDVLLDVPELKVDKIVLEVEDLRAHVSILAELANLVNLSVGADVRLERVKLEIEGVEAQALLKVRLENVRAILEKALDTIRENPQILEGLAETADRALDGVGGVTREAVGEDGAVSRLFGGVGEAAQDLGEEVGRVAEGAGGPVEQASGQAVGGSRGAAEGARRDELRGPQTTSAARRRAQDLGVDLSQVQGSGAGGQIILADVKNAARGR